MTSVVLLACFLSRSHSQNAFRFVLYGDCRDGHEVHRKLIALAEKIHPDFILQTGDLVHRGSDDSLWQTYDSITGDLRKRIPIYPSRGNHDLGGQGYEARVTAPRSNGDAIHYSFDKAGWHFVALAIDEQTTYAPGSEQYTWMEKDLAQAQKAGEHIAVFFHVPPYSIGRHGSDLDVRSTLCPVFKRYGVSLVLNGHDHIYYHTMRDGIAYFVSGGGGAPLYPVNPSKGALPTDKFESVNHLVEFDVDGDEVKGRAIRADGSTIEAFTLTAKPSNR